MTLDNRKFYLISELCPVSQYVTPILEKTAKCELVQEAHLEFWEKAYNRTRQHSSIHDLRTCACRFCSRDRETLRQAIDPLLTRDEAEIIDFCDPIPLQKKELSSSASGYQGRNPRKSPGRSGSQGQGSPESPRVLPKN